MSVHYATTDLDQGPIITRRAFNVPDDAEELKRRGQPLEAEALLEAVRLHLDKAVAAHRGRVEVREEGTTNSGWILPPTRSLPTARSTAWVLPPTPRRTRSGGPRLTAGDFVTRTNSLDHDRPETGVPIGSIPLVLFNYGNQNLLISM